MFILHKNEKGGDILYIGNGGTVKQNGEFEKQELKERINNRQNKEQMRKAFLSLKMKENKDLQEIFIEWCILDKNKCLPSAVKADLLQQYYLKHKCLPIWNKKF